MTTKFCTSCQAVRDLAGGQYRPTRNAKRWVCKSCLERKSVSLYRSQPKPLLPHWSDR